MKTLVHVLAGAAILATAPAAAAVNEFTNGSFEDGLNGWNLAGVIGSPPLAEPPVVIPYNTAAPYPGGAHGEAIPMPGATGNPGLDPIGNNALYFVADGPGPQTLSQTVNLTAGAYQVGFDFYLPLNGFNNQGEAVLRAFVGNDLIATFVASTQAPQVWQHFSDTMNLQANSAVTFTFSYGASTFPAKDFVIDRAYLVAVPEPASWAMMIGGFGLLGAAARRRRSIQVTFA
jgi:hypothetical protein